jgi:lambda family phage portal protein
VTVNALDRMLLAVSPRWALSRIRARAQVGIIARHFEAAAYGRRTNNWSRRGTDANAAAGGTALSVLRAQARDLVRNNPWARRGKRRITVNTVGWGIRPKAAGVAAERIAELWKKWGETTECDADRRLTFYGLERQVMDTVVEAGEILVRRRFRRPSDGLSIPLQLQLLEPDFLDTSRDNLPGQQGGQIVQGVEFDAIDRRVAYWLFDEHPGSGRFVSPASRRVPASEVLHVFSQERPGQVRGPSWFAPVDVRLHEFDEYEDATLMRQKIAACFAAFVTDVDGTGTPLGEAGTDTASEQKVDTFEPGMIVNLPIGKSVVTANPPATNDHASFSATALRGVAAGLGTTYEDMTGDYCVSPETRILRSDLRWVRADSLRAGDHIVAFDEHAPGGRGGRRKWRKAEVVRAGRRELDRRRVVTDAASATVSDEHLFLCTSRPDERPKRGAGLQARSENPQSPGPGQRWVRADRLRPGDRILFLHAPWEVGDTHGHGYLKGMADGEGCLDQQSAHLRIAQNPGVVFQETGVALRSLGFSPIQGNANGGGTNQQWSLTGIGECLRFLGEVRPSRLLAKADSVFIGRMIAGGSQKHGHATFATVVSIDAIGPGPVITLGTSTQTLVTEGLLSHNSQVNFSSARMSRLAHYGDVHDWRWNMLIPLFCAPAWSWMLEAAVLAGLIEDDRQPAEWTPPPMPMTDPEKEGLALSRLVRTGAKTHDEMVREQGYDPEEFWAEYAAGLKRLDEKGIWLDSDVRKVSSTGQSQASGTKPDGTMKPMGKPNGAGKPDATAEDGEEPVEEGA